MPDLIHLSAEKGKQGDPAAECDQLLAKITDWID
jgi:hypothetical protein